MFKVGKIGQAQKVIEKLFKTINDQLFVAQKQWSINITSVTDSNYYCTKLHECAIDIDFSNWRRNDDNHNPELFLPMVSLLMERESTQAKDEMGVFAARKFDKGEVIGLFYSDITIKKP
jgi:hypothetical protein